MALLGANFKNKYSNFKKDVDPYTWIFYSVLKIELIYNHIVFHYWFLICMVYKARIYFMLQIDNIILILNFLLQRSTKNH